MIDWPIPTLISTATILCVTVFLVPLFLRQYAQLLTGLFVVASALTVLVVLFAATFELDGGRITLEWLGSSLQPRFFRIEWMIQRLPLISGLLGMIALSFVCFRGGKWKHSPVATSGAVFLLAAALLVMMISASGWNAAFVMALILGAQLFAVHIGEGRDEEQATDFANLAIEQGLGALAVFVGTILLSGVGVDVGWYLAVRPAGQALELDLGVGLTLIGLLVTTKAPFFSAWTMKRRGKGSPIQSLLIVGVPSFVCAQLFFRLLPLIEQTHSTLFLLKGLLILIFSGFVLSLFQRETLRAFDQWWGAAGLFSWAGAIVLHEIQGLAIAVSVLVGASTLSLAWASPESSTHSFGDSRRWRGFLILIGGLVATSVVGSAGGASMSQWLSYGLASGIEWLPFIVCIGLSVWSLHRVAWVAVSQLDNSPFRWPDLLFLFVFLLLGLAPAWTGAFVFPTEDGGGRFMVSLFPIDQTLPAPSNLSTGLLFLFVVQIVFFALSYALKARWDSYAGSVGRISRTIERWAHFDGVFRNAISAAVQPVIWFETRLLQHRFRSVALSIVAKFFHGAAKALSDFDQAGSSRLNRTFATVVEVPAKLMQLSQNGDVQWYMFLTLFWTLFVLIHFLIF
jgi:hypothetical protein